MKLSFLAFGLAALELAACSGSVSSGGGARADALDGPSRFAVNIDPANEAAWAQSSPARLASEGFHGVRLVSRAGIQSRIDELKAQGLLVMAVITSESAGYVPWNADFLQIGNEPDDGNTYS